MELEKIIKGEWNFSDRVLETEREIEVLNFQRRIMDLIYLEDTDDSDKLKFIKIILSNLREFISVRLSEIKSMKLVDVVLQEIESIYSELNRLFIDILEKYHIEPKSLQKDFTYTILCHNKENKYSILCTEEDFSIDDPGVEYIIHTPKEILNFKEYESEYSKLFYQEPVEHRFIYQKFHDIIVNDLLIHTPFTSFSTVTDFIKEMCNDPNITQIYMTLYRIDKDNPIIRSLIHAAKTGKQVFVYVEVSARGDEENNKLLAEHLDQNRICVKTSYFTYKVHAKMFCAVDNRGYKFVHIGTGNYNRTTSKIYTDLHFFTTDIRITEPIMNIIMSIFQSKEIRLNGSSLVWASPLNLREMIIHMIRKEREKGVAGIIRLKCNHIFDDPIISELYKAAEDGVNVQIICRTSCSIQPTENLIIKSKVGDFLEHDRFYIFGDRLFISSADLLFRNMKKRVEILCEIPSEYYKKEIFCLFDDIWNSNHIHIKQTDGSWKMT